jgi:hypothetical protein
MPKIAISYRRSDSDVTGRIFDRVAERYGKDSVFRDIDSIPFGSDFRKVVNDALQDADALIAIVGPNWRGGESLESAKINNDSDFVRTEIETALQRDIPVIPVLVDGAHMPEAAELPESLRQFSFRNAAIIDSGRNFDTDVERLLRSMDRLFKGKLSHPGALDGRTRSRYAALVGILMLTALAVIFFYKVASTTAPVDSTTALVAGNTASVSSTTTPVPRSTLPETRTFDYPTYAGYRLDFCYRWTQLCGKGAAIRFCNSNNYQSVADDNGFSIDPSVGNTITPGDNQVGGRDGFKFIKCVGPIK